MPSHHLSELEFITRLLTGAALGIIIGFERQWRQRLVGLHTSSLVATGATLFALISPFLGEGPYDRTVANIVTGVGFLAGGVIIRDGMTVRGLNTAATMWATAAVGALAGIGAELYAALGAGVILLLNMFLWPVTSLIEGRTKANEPTNYNVTVTCDASGDRAVRSTLVDMVSASPTLALRSVKLRADPGGRSLFAELSDSRRDDDVLTAIVDKLSTLPGVTSAVWRTSDT